MSDPYFFRTPDEKKIPTIGLSAFFLAILGLFAFLGFFVFPIADDHLYAMSVTHNGTFSHFLHMYTTASGRFAANLLYGVTAIFVGNLTLYHTVAAIHIVLLVLCVRALVAACHEGGKSSCWLITLCLCAAFVAGLPSSRQTLYWLCGTIVYFIPFNALFGVWAITAMLAFSPFSVKKRHMAILFGLLPLAMGGNEITASTCLFFFFLAWICARRTGHPQKRLFGYLLLTATVLLLFSFLAPGNFVRAGEIASESGRSWQWKFLLRPFGGAFEGYKWIFATPVLPAVALCCLYLKPRWKPCDFGLSPTKRAAIVLGLGCLLFFGEFLLAYLAGKRAPSARIQTAIYASAFAFTLAATVFLMKDILWLRSWLAQRIKANTLLAAAGGAAILMTLAQPNVSSAIRNLANGELFAYREAWLNRLALIPPEPSGENLVLTLPALPSQPYPVAFEDFLDSSDKKHQWIRLAFARYHGLKDITVDHAPAAPGNIVNGSKP